MAETRFIGNHELWLSDRFDVDKSNEGMQVVALTLLTRHAIDEGLLKCALQELQHTFPQLLSCIRSPLFEPMVCPLLPLEGIEQGKREKVKDFFRQPMDTKNGPLWEVRLVTKENFDQVNLGLGPELRALLAKAESETDDEKDGRWHSFLRYMQGKVNQSDLANFDSAYEGYSSLIVMSFHPSIADTLTSFYFAHIFLTHLEAIVSTERKDAKQRKDGGNADLNSSSTWSEPIETLVGSMESQLSDKWDEFLPRELRSMWTDFFIKPTDLASSMTALIKKQNESNQQSCLELLMGCLDLAESKELNAMMQEKDVSMQCVLLAAALASVSKCICNEKQRYSTTPQCDNEDQLNLTVAIETSMRRYSRFVFPKYGSNSIDFVLSFESKPAKFVQWDKQGFWLFANEINDTLNEQLVKKQPIKQLKSSVKQLADMKVAAFGDLSQLFVRDGDPSNFSVRLEDVFHMANEPTYSLVHRAHLLNNQLHYILCYNNRLIEQRTAFAIRDETLATLRMASEK